MVGIAEVHKLRSYNNECSFISEDNFENVLTSRCIWICQKCDFVIFWDSFFGDQLNLMIENRSDPLKRI